MKFAFIAQEVAFLVEMMFRVLSVTRSGFYAWKKRPTAGAFARFSVPSPATTGWRSGIPS
jgi:nicotinamide riboside transporter PnuC